MYIMVRVVMMAVATGEIIRAFKQGREREENFRHLFERYYAPVTRFFQRNGLSPEDSRGLTQETFISVYRGLDGYVETAPFESWLYTLALNVYRNEIERRRAKKRDAPQVSLDDPGGPEPAPALAARLAAPALDPMQALLEKERVQHIHAAMQALPEQMRRCVQMRVVNDLSYQEIAGVLGLAVNTVKAHLHQARRILKEKLRDYVFEEEA